MLEAANIIGQQEPEVIYLLPPANESLKIAAEQLINDCSDKVKISIWDGNVYDVMSHADAAMVCSGTATLETGCFGTPMVVLYKINPLTYFFAKRLVNVPNIGMINLMAETEIVKELIQKDANPQNIADEILRLLTDQSYHDRLSRQLLDVKERLGSPGASGRAAKEILELIKK